MPRYTPAALAAYTARTGLTIPDAPARPARGAQKGQQPHAGIERRGNKYGAVKTEYAGRVYDSRLEAACAARLDLLVTSGHVLEWTPQPEFELHAGIKYRSDFHVVYAVGLPRVIDAKGHSNAVFRLKRRLFETDYGPLDVVRTVDEIPLEGR